MIRAFRPINLLVIVLVCFVFQLLSSRINGSDFHITSEFLAYTLSALLIGAGGYLINGHYDREIDKSNHDGYEFPFSKNRTYSISLFLIGLAIVIGLTYFSFNFTLGFIVLPIVALWLYSALFKKLPFIGNLTIAFVSLWLPLGLLYLNTRFNGLSEQSLYAQWTMVMLSEIFLITLARELIKDIQDIEGDKAGKCHTLPILIGENISAGISSVIITMGGLIWYNVLTIYFGKLSAVSIVFGIITLLLLLFSIIFLWLKKSWKENAKLASLSIKIGMLIALLTTLFI